FFRGQIYALLKTLGVTKSCLLTRGRLSTITASDRLWEFFSAGILVSGIIHVRAASLVMWAVTLFRDMHENALTL
ncbi:hypothetical protein H4S03_007475, partial [Coemansia sp. S3946]